MKAIKIFLIIISSSTFLKVTAQSVISERQLKDNTISFFRDGNFHIDIHGSYQFDSKLTEILGGTSPTSGITEGDIPNDFGFSAAIGRSFPVSDNFGDLIIEGEFLYHPSSEIQEFGGFEFDNEFNIRSFIGNINWVYPTRILNFLIGAGAGTTNITLKTTPIDNPSFEPFEQDASGFIYQLQAGINLPIGDLFSLNLGYRFSEANDVNEDLTDPTNGEMINLKWDATTHRGEIGIGVRF